MAPYTAEYPRPDFQRPNPTWQSLEGPWDFVFDDKDAGLGEKWQLRGLSSSVSAAQHKTIKVPFAFQTPASGIGEQGAHEVLWYEREVSDIRTPDQHQRGDRLLLRFGAVDYDASVWANGIPVGSHRGGYVPFNVDLSDAVAATAAPTGKPSAVRLTLRVRDSPSDTSQPRGKQYWGPEPEDIFYTPTSGIWQSVWLESVPSVRLGDGSDGTVLRSDDIQGGSLKCKVAVTGRPAAAKFSVEVRAALGGVAVTTGKAELPKDKEFATLDLNLRLSPQQLQALPAEITQKYPPGESRYWSNGLALWSPESPILYDIELSLLDGNGAQVDQVSMVTGMRSISHTTGDGTLRLNGKPYFHALVLDQGYWPETGLTPPSQASLKADVELSKKMGFNGCRKHQKVEDPLFHYWADKLGYLIWGEIGNAYDFNDDYVARFNAEWIEAVKRDISHPSVVAWTPVNESWGYPDLKGSQVQRQHLRALYHLTKTVDPSRPINDNCGWEHVCTDLSTFHDYSDGPQLETICSSLDTALGPHAGRATFVGPIDDKLFPDSGTSHNKGAPVICTEFGGVNIAPAKGEEGKAGAKDWGYTTAADPEDLLRRINHLFTAVVKHGHCCGLVYTQLSDIEQEVNGLYTFDRREKINATRVRNLIEGVKKTYYDSVKSA